MDIKTLNPGDKVSLKTREKSWRGHVLESHDPEIILLKLETGYNIGLRESEILNVEVIEKAKQIEKSSLSQIKNPKLKNIALIITGGTISSRLDSKTGGVIPTDEEELLKIAPEIKDICNIVEIKKPVMKDSGEMDPEDWIKIASVAEKMLNDEKIDGLIVTHGTDSLHYTSAALSFFLGRLNKPLAVTYSQRSIDRGSTDAHLNLICAAKYASSDIAQVALIGHKDSNDNICLAIPGTKVRKMHTSTRDAFKPINTLPLAEISLEKFDILKEFNARDNSKKIKLDNVFNNKVAIIKYHPGLSPSIIDYYVNEGYKGLIIEVLGLGQIAGKHSKYNWLPTIKKAIEKGVVICATAQTINGRLNPNVYSTGRDLQKTGILFLEDMLSETAFVKLGWILAHPKWNAQEKILE